MGVQNSPILEVAIGLVFIYLIFGLICTAANELVSQAFRLRAATLWGAVRALLDDPTGTKAAKDLYNHHLIKSLAVRNGAKVNAGGDDPNTRSNPSYITPSLFSLALIDKIVNPDDKPGSIAHPTTAEILEKLPNSGLSEKVQQALVPLIRSAGTDLDQARKNIEDWYDAGMERATGWYKQRIQGVTLFVGFLAVFLANADTLMLADRLWANPAEREQLVAAARSAQTNPEFKGATHPKLPADGSTPDVAADIKNFPKVPPAAQSLVGWVGPVDSAARTYVATEPRRFPRDAGEWLYKLLGLLLTAFAASLGAPFWFDVLNKIVNMRSSGPSPNDAPRVPARKPDPKTRIGSTQPADTVGPTGAIEPGGSV